MTNESRQSLQAIAMHGWASDARCWSPWIAATQKLGWNWRLGERGYGEMEAMDPVWPVELPSTAPRIVIGHSLGPHLVAPDVLQQADAIVLLASFADFVPPDRAGRRVRAGLDGMAAKLADEKQAKEMLHKFFLNVAAPQSPELLPVGPAEGALNLSRLRGDLDVLRDCSGPPSGFPTAARVLIVEAEEDRIVGPEARAMLRAALPQADVISLPGVGHALLAGDVVRRVAEWVEAWRGKV